MLPKNEKIVRDSTEALRLYVYGEPNIGKTTFANTFPEVLMLNTDGNVKHFTTPELRIVETGNLSAWEVFVGAVDEIVKGNHTYKTIVVDLIEDVYNYCRMYYNKKLEVDHEGELGFARGYDIIRNAFMLVVRKLSNSGYNVVFISHEQEKTIKSRTGLETSKSVPALSEKVATRIAGSVDITGRIKVNTTLDDKGKAVDTRILDLSINSDQLGGSKIPSLTKTELELNYNALVKAIKGEK